MKIYRITGDWLERTPLGSLRPIVYADTRAEARSVARTMAGNASSNPNLDARLDFTATVHVCEVSEGLGRGRRFAVALLNDEGVLEVRESLYKVQRPPATIRCAACGAKHRAQELNGTPDGLICLKCFDDRYLYDGPLPDSHMSPEEVKQVSDVLHGFVTGGR